MEELRPQERHHENVNPETCKAMSLEIRLNERVSKVELVSRDKNKTQIKIDDALFDVDIILVEKGVYSIIMEGKSYIVELLEGDTAKKYSASASNQSFDLEVIDAESRYMMSRKENDLEDDGNQISSPMPGKVVKLMVKEGDKVKAGETVIIISAMKMESEYKAGHDGVIAKVHVKEGDTIEGNQTLVTLG